MLKNSWICLQFLPPLLEMTRVSVFSGGLEGHTARRKKTKQNNYLCK